MIRITIDRNEGEETVFDIDSNFRTAILGENGIGKTSILEAIKNKDSSNSWLSVRVPKKMKIEYLSQIKINEEKISGGEYARKRLDMLFASSADLYVLDEPTNNLDAGNMAWLKEYILQYKTPILFTSHDLDFIDTLAEVIFYVDSKTVEKTKEKCSQYLNARKERINKAFILYEVNLRKQKLLFETAQETKKRGALGAKWVGNDNDKYQRGANRESAGKSGSLGRRLEERAQMMEIEKPQYDALPCISLFSGPKLAGCLFSVATTTLSQKRLTLNVVMGDKIIIVGENGAGKTTLLSYLHELIEKKNFLKAGDTFAVGGKFSFVYIKQDWYEHIDDTKVSEYAGRFGLSKQEIFKSLSLNRLDERNYERKFKDLSPGVRIKILLGVLSSKKFDLIIWDEPTNHLDVMTQVILREAFEKYSGALVIASHDKILMSSKIFRRIEI